MKKIFATVLIWAIWIVITSSASAQNNLVTYAGGSGKETFYDVLQLTDGTFLVSGYAANLDWIDENVPITQLNYSGTIPNGQGSNRFGILLHFSQNFQQLLHVVHFPQGAVEDIRFIKTNTQPYQPTGDLYISCNTADTDANDGGFIIAKLNHNFLPQPPDEASWIHTVWAKSVVKENHPWDVTNDGRVFYITGEAHAYNWSAVYCLDQNGQRTRVENWRTHWLKNGSEWRGTPASANPLGSPDSVSHSGIVLKAWGRCDLRSWTWADFQLAQPDENGGIKLGKWPLDILFNSPCDPAAPSANGPGYTGYGLSGTPVYGGQSILVDKRNNDLYIGMHFKSVLPDGQPDFEPAVIAMDESGQLRWWSRLYHEITPAGDTMVSTPDQYVDALALDFANNQLVVGARCHGNNVENFWEGNTIATNPNAQGFQNRFTGSSGNIHISWLGKLSIEDGTLMHATYMAELAEGTGGLGSPHPDPNLAGWPNPNSGYPDVNTTRMARNNMKVTSSGDIVVIAVGRRTITTANAYQKMVKPYFGGQSAWNSFVRVYDPALQLPKYSSLVVGVWDTLTQLGGGNTELFGVYKTVDGVVCVGRQTADNAGTPNGNNLPVTNIPAWGDANPEQESAILVYYTATALYNPDDMIEETSSTEHPGQASPKVWVYPNPGSNEIYLQSTAEEATYAEVTYQIYSTTGAEVQSGRYTPGQAISLSLPDGMYVLTVQWDAAVSNTKFVVRR